MRIALVTREFPPLTEYTGGIGRAYAALAPAFADEGHDVTVVVPGLDPARADLSLGFTVAPARCFGAQRPSAVANVVTTALAQRRLDRLGPFDVVLAPEWHGDDAPLLRRSDRALHVTNLVSSLAQIRSAQADARRIGDLRPHRLAQSWLEQRQAETAGAIVACSGAVCRWARELWDIDAKRTAVIPNGIDRAAVARLARQPAPEWFPRSGRTVVFAGRLEAVKGVTVLAEAMRTVWSHDVDVQLVLIGGDGSWRGKPMSSELRRIAGQHADRVVMPGVQPPELLFPALAAADVVALPSLWENLSLVGLEALTVGAPLVVTRETGFEDIVEHEVNGLLVTPGEPAELGAALCRLLADSDLCCRFGGEAGASSGRFDIRTVARRYLEFFAELTRTVRAAGRIAA